LYQQASNYYLENGGADKAAESLQKAAEYIITILKKKIQKSQQKNKKKQNRTIKEVNADKAIEYYISACDLYISESREQFSQDAFRNTINLQIKTKKY